MTLPYCRLWLKAQQGYVGSSQVITLGETEEVCAKAKFGRKLIPNFSSDILPCMNIFNCNRPRCCWASLSTYDVKCINRKIVYSFTSWSSEGSIA